jgi:peptide/nickel transport system substrate-binding protein
MTGSAAHSTSALCSAVLLLAILAGPTAAQEQTLVVGESFSLKSLDPGRTLTLTTVMVGHSVYDSLLTFEGDDTRTPRPSLATGWSVSSDARIYTFRLRPNVRFSSGNPLTSADVKWSLERAKNLKSTSGLLLATVQEITAPDTLTVVLRLAAPNPALLAILTSPGLAILDSTLLIAHGGDAGPQANERDGAERFLNGQSAGTGAYVLQRYVPDQEVVLASNPNHWRGQPRLDRIVIRHVPEPIIRRQLVERGDLDIALDLDRDHVEALRAAPGVTVRTRLLPSSMAVLLNNDPQVGGAFANPKVQEAVRYALDYDGILALAAPGSVRLAGVIPSGLAGALDPGEAIRMDRDRARTLLREAGLPAVTGTITFAADRSVHGLDLRLLAQKVQADLAAVGMSVSLNGLPRPLALRLYQDGKNQIGLASWMADYPDATNFLVYAPGRVVGRRVGWPADASPAAQELARLAHEAESESDAARRVALLVRFQRGITRAGPYVMLFQPASGYAFRSTVQGVTSHPVWSIDFWTVSK